MSLISPNIRPACGQPAGVPPMDSIGCGNQSVNPLAGVKIKYNNTQMMDYHTATCHNFVPVFTTLPLSQNTPFCVPAYDCGDCTNDENWCFPNIDPSYFYSGDGTGSVSFEVAAIWNNTYSQSNDTMSFTSCNTLGFKRVVASKAWQGIHSFTSNVWGKPDFVDWCCDGCTKKEYDTTVDNTKYRTVSAWATWDVHGHNFPTHVPSGDPYECCTCIDSNCQPCTCGDDGCPTCGTPDGCTCQCYTGTDAGYKDYGGAASSTDTVDIYGNHTGTCASSSYGGDTYSSCNGDPDCIAAADAYLAGAVFGMMSEGNTNWIALISIFSGYACGEGSLGVPYSVESAGPGSWTLKYQGTYDCLNFSGCGCCTDDPVGGTYDRAIISITPTDVDVVLNTVSIGGHFYDLDYCSDSGTHKEVFQKQHDHWSFSATTYDHTSDKVYNDYSPSSGYNNTHAHVELSDPYTSQDTYNEIVKLMATWDMGNDKVYPWRNSANKTIGPYVHYDEVASAPSIGQWCNTGSQPHYTGRIIGAPGPEGIDRIWNPTHPNWCVCDDPNSPGNFCIYIDSYGAWSTECEVPRATEWISWRDANQMADGAFVGAGFFWSMPCVDNSTGPVQLISDPILWGAKYSELIFPRQSVNYFRPGGIDRIQPSASLSWCATGSSANTIELQTPMPNFDSEPIIVAGVGGIDDGVYSANWGGTTITLTGTVASGSWFPTPTMPYPGTGCVARLQWPGMTTGICGRLQVLTATRPSSSFPYTCSVELPGAYWFNNDKVTITNCNGGLNINGTWTVTPIDAFHIVLQGSQTKPDATYFGQGQIQNLFAPDWKWNDTSPKGDFQVLQWLYNYRDIGEWYRVTGSAVWNSGLAQSCCPSPGCGNSCPPTCDCPQPAVPTHPRQNQCGLDENVATMSCDTTCLNYNVCAPMVAYFSPNYGSESFSKDSSRNYGFQFPGMDTNYGSMWRGIFRQTIDDPYYVAPPCPCSPDTDPESLITTYDCSNCQWIMDDGTCQTDQPGDEDLGIPCIKYFPHVPQYEARCEVPTGAPPLVLPAKMGCVTTANPDCINKTVCQAPQSPNTFPLVSACNAGIYLQYPYEYPWILLQLEESCVCADGRFADIYASNGINCPDSEIVGPP